MGRELDALIAEKVMGWENVHKHGSRLVGIPPTQPGIPVCLAGGEIPPYSTDIAAAWEVVEKLQKDNPFWKTSNYEGWMNFNLGPTTGNDGFGWYANFGDSNTIAYGKTAPHAICLAALKALGVEV